MSDLSPRSSDKIDALLSRGGLGGPLREEIAGRVLDARASRRKWGRTIGAVAVPILAMAAGVALFVMPRERSEFTAKGGAVTTPALEVVCTTGETARCPRGQQIFFRMEDTQESGFLEAWAEPVLGGERVWYFEGDGALSVVGQPGAQTMKRAVRIGPEQPPGAYRIHLVLSRGALSRADALAGRGDVLATAIVTLEVTP